MSQLEIGQAKVSSMTSQTLEAMSSGQRELMAQQEKLKTSQQSVQSFVAENLRELTHEKALIAAGQRELARMTDNIRKKLDATSGMMRTNEKQRQVSHSELLKDLSAVHEYAKFLRDKLGEDQFGSFVHRLFLSCLHLSLCILMHSLSFLTVKQGRLILLCHNSCSLVPPESD